MSESLRDQLLKAGFKSKTSEPAGKNRSAQNKSVQKKRARQAGNRQSKSLKSGGSADQPHSIQARTGEPASSQFPDGSGSAPPENSAGNSVGPKGGTWRPAGHRRAGQYRAAPKPVPEHQSAAAKKRKVKKAPAVKPRPGSWASGNHDAPELEQIPSGIPSELPGRPAAGPPAGPAAGLAKSSIEPPVVENVDPTVLSEIERQIREHACSSWQGRHLYRFTLNNRIREISVTAETRTQLSESVSGITCHYGRLCIVPAAVIRQITRQHPNAHVFLAGSGSSTPDDDPDYGDHPIPDDLSW